MKLPTFLVYFLFLKRSCTPILRYSWVRALERDLMRKTVRDIFHPHLPSSIISSISISFLLGRSGLFEPLFTHLSTPRVRLRCSIRDLWHMCVADMNTRAENLAFARLAIHAGPNVVPWTAQSSAESTRLRKWHSPPHSRRLVTARWIIYVCCVFLESTQ